MKRIKLVCAQHALLNIAVISLLKLNIRVRSFFYFSLYFLVHILKERTTDLKEKYMKKIEELEKARATKEKERNILAQNQDEQIKSINLEFSSLVKKLEEKKEEVLKLYQKYSNEQLDQVHMSLATESSFFDLAQKNLASLQKYQEELGKHNISIIF